MNSQEAKEFYKAIDLLAKEKNMDKDRLAEDLKTALVLAVKKQYGKHSNVVIDMDQSKNKLKIYIEKTVVENVTKPLCEISLEDALKVSKRAKLGKTVKIPVNSKKMGRLAAVAAKQHIYQNVRNVERQQINMMLKEKVGQILLCKVVSVDPQTQHAIVKFSDSSSSILFRSKQLPNDNLQAGDVIRVYVEDLVKSSLSSNLKITRNDPCFVEGLFVREIPEIANKQIEIKAIAREAGFRTKIALKSNDENINPVGSCIGEKGLRLNAIVNELKGEKIDLVPYSDNKKEFIAAALSPAQVAEVEIMVDPTTNEETAFVSVPDSQLSLAIGNKGVNAKLAALLTGHKIDINPESGFYGEDKESSLKEKLELRFKQKQSKPNPN